MSYQEDLDSFEYWLADMDDSIERFIEKLSEDIRGQLDFSVSSLNVIEQWLLEKYDSPEKITASSESKVVDGAARYVGETFRNNIGGKWEIKLDDPKYIYYGIPQLAGFSEKSTPICPVTLVTASTDRRTGQFLSTVLKGCLKDVGTA